MISRVGSIARGLICALLAVFSIDAHGAEAELAVGVARVDITPEYSVRLSGFGFRRAESEGVAHRIYAKALAFGDKELGPAILITTDNLGIPEEITREVASRLQSEVGLRPERLAITATHTHTAPMLRGVAPTLFGTEIPAEHQERIDRYTREFTERLVEVGIAAVRDIKPGKVEWGIGKMDFARNRRKQGGPVDHDLPLLVVRAPNGKVRAVWFSYACHCVTMANNRVSGDWAGYAQTAIERDHAGAIALASIGCGADANPSTRSNNDDASIAVGQGDQIAAEVRRLIEGKLVEIQSAPQTKSTRVRLPFDTARTRAEWEQRAAQDGAVGFHAKVNLARLDRGEALPDGLDYPVQTWVFGQQLALVFLPGEVVVDYAIRFKEEFDCNRLIVVAYANDSPGYVPSERILREGGYEGGDAMIYYDRPQRFAEGVERRITDAVHMLMPADFVSPKATRGTEGTRPKLPEESMDCARVKPGFRLELVAAEPLVESPAAIDWDARGRLWVCEMFDYPTGVDEQWKPGGRIKVLTDTDGDGRYDKATTFLDKLPFPTGVMAWKGGALICAAPDILFAEDTDGDGRADRVEKLFTGFATDNYQARVNGLALGLDNWIHGANGLLGGRIRGGKIEGELDLGKQDFRMRPGGWEFEKATGLSQHGRVRDDWNRWFGCDNSRMLFHFPLADRYVRRNPAVAGLSPTAVVPQYPEHNRVFPISKPLERYNHPESAGRATSACGVAIYRDVLLGNAFAGNAFTCEPVHNLVHREVLATDGVTFTSRRADDEAEAEFLASTDHWFRPVQVRTGPDGALYVVDMYRFLIEHPRWIPADRLARIEARAGAGFGRIYRVVPEGGELRPVRDLRAMKPGELAAALDSPNGTERDRVHVEFLARDGEEAAKGLAKIATTSHHPAARAQALSVLSGLGALTPAMITMALTDVDPGVRVIALELAEPFLREANRGTEALRRAVPALQYDRERWVRYQLALTLGELDTAQAAAALRRLAESDDAKLPPFRAALLSSAAMHRELAGLLGSEAPPPVLAPLSPEEEARLTGDPAATAARTEVFQKFEPALARAGDKKRGAEVFARACALCHSMGSAGFHVGPDLVPLRDKPADYWLKNILDPNAAIEPRFAATIVILKNGAKHAGIVAAETGTSLTLRQAGGLQGVLLKSEIERSISARSSLMPSDFERTISPEEMTDLIAFMRSGGNAE